jgi:molybdopterin-binding protein
MAGEWPAKSPPPSFHGTLKPGELPRRNAMKVSARNLIPGKIKELTNGAVNSEVVIEVSPGIEIVSIITKHSVESLGLKVGMPVKAMMKASEVMIVTD